ncbi:MAG: TraR/DksA family transcriptional regulator [Paucimonas sp.]|jgi:DnaK suppressor protein|nr:TraR/DksA family transcriptional regulator [Paucimonas sp.]
MSSLPNDVLERLKAQLDQREKALLDDVRREEAQKDDYADLASEAPDPGDNAFADLSTDLDNAAIGRDMQELRAIERARERIGNGSYGTCIDCGEPIPEARLMAQPTAERCARDQEHFEKTHAGGRGASM